MRMDLQAQQGGSSGAAKRRTPVREAKGEGDTRRRSRGVPLSESKEQAAFKYLFRETSLESIRRCLANIRDQEIVEFLQDGIIRIAAVMSSECLTGLERTRRELRRVHSQVAADPSSARRLYDQHVEALGQLTFALSRRLDQYEEFLSRCPFTGSAETLRGLYGQKVRDLAGDVHFLRVELNRWVRRSVPLRGRISDGEEDREFLEGRTTAVIDDLGLRMKELQEILTAVIYDQLVVFDDTLTRSKLFKKDIGNFLDLDQLLSWLTELMSRIKDYDAQRHPEKLERVKSLLRDFRPDRFPALSGVRESDHAMFFELIPRILDWRPEQKARRDDPIHVFLLLLGDMVGSLKHVGAEAAPFDPDF